MALRKGSAKTERDVARAIGSAKIAPQRSSVGGVKAADWISLAGVAVAALSALVAMVSAKRAAAAQRAAATHQASAETERRLARQAAEDAAIAQREAAAEAGRVAEAIENQNQRADERAQQAEGVPWRITHHDRDLYDLWNDTNTAKFGVEVSGPGVAGVDGPFDRIDGRSSEQFLINPFGAGFTQVVVTWHRREDLSDEPRRWTCSKPPKL